MGFVTILAACVQKGAETCAQPASVSQDHFQVIVGAIVSGFVALLGLLGIVIQRQGSASKKATVAAEHAKAASFGINNDHKKNFRDDFDEFKRDVFLSLGELKGEVKSLNGRVDNVETTQGGRHATR